LNWDSDVKITENAPDRYASRLSCMKYNAETL